MNLLKIFIKADPLESPSGVLVFKYGAGVFYLAVAVVMITVAAMALDPPTKPGNLLIALLLVGAALFMCIQTSGYCLRLEDESIIRKSPWPWHKQNVFLLIEISRIDITYRALHVSLFMNDGRELSVPIMLNGSFKLLQKAVNNSNAAITDKVRNIIEYYSMN